MYQKMLSRQEIHLLLPELLAAARKEKPFSLLLLKPADFRLLQLEATPTACDAVLKMVAGLIQSCAPSRAQAGHWGGITFALLLPSYPKSEAETLAEEISARLSREALPQVFNLRKLHLIFAAAEAPPRSLCQLGLQAEKSLAKEEGRFLPLMEKSFNQEDFLKSFLHGFLQANDSYLCQHSLLSTRLVHKLATALGLKPKAKDDLALAAGIADVGMLLGGDHILLLPRPLAPAEYRIIKRHPRFAANLACAIGLSEEVAQAVLTHHERWDGLGYPRGLLGEEIPFMGRALGLCSAYAALLLPRPYRRALVPATARDLLRQNCGKAFDPQLTRLVALLPLEGERQPASIGEAADRR